MTDALATAPTSLDDLLDPSLEEDLSGAGLQPTRIDWTITGAERKESKSGEGLVNHIEFTSLEPVGAIDEFRVTDYITVFHPNVGVVAGGLSKMKRIYLAAFGVATGSLTRLIGRTVNAEAFEDVEGFRKMRGYRPPVGTVSAVTGGEDI